MRALELSLRNYRVFEEVDLELPARVIGIFGENGAGKTSLLESMAFALFGVDAARTKKDQIRTQGVLLDCEVRLAFEHAGQPYVVRRSLRGRGNTPEAELHAGDLLQASGVTEVDAEIARLLHMDLRVFRASVYAEQKQLDSFSDVTAGKRKEMALRLLGIRPVEDAQRAARRESRAALASAQQLAGAVADTAELEADLKVAKDVVSDARAAARAAAAELRAAGAAAKAATSAFERADAAREKVEKIVVELRAKTEERGRLAEQLEERRARVAALETALADAPLLEEELAGLEGSGERLAAGEALAVIATKLHAAERQLEASAAVDVEPLATAWEQARGSFRGAEQRAAASTARAAHARDLLEAAHIRIDRAADADPSAPCPTCGQPLGVNFAAYVRHLKAEAAVAKKESAAAERVARAADAERKKAEAAVAKAQKAAADAQDRALRRDRSAEQVDELRAEATPLLERFDGAPPDVERLRVDDRRARELEKRIAAIQGERGHLSAATGDVAKLSARLNDLDGQLARLASKAEGFGFDPERHAELRQTRDRADEALGVARDSERRAADELAGAEKAAGALAGRLEEANAMERKVGDLRADARYLERTSMLLDGFRDHLVARVGPALSHESEALFRELTNHEYDDLRVNEETLAIEIADGDGYFPIERFSGSETDLANLALRVAISAHLSRVSGADLGMLVLDEVLGALDTERKDLMVQALARLAGRFHQLFVITHAERVKDQFPASVEVRKTGRRRSTAVLV